MTALGYVSGAKADRVWQEVFPEILFLTVRLRKHPLLHREGHDLSLDVPITVREAIEGAEVDVPTFAGGVRVTVPSGSQSGKRLRLRGRGLPSRQGAPGDFYVVLQVQVPASTEETKHAAKELDAGYAEPVRGKLAL